MQFLGWVILNLPGTNNVALTSLSLDKMATMLQIIFSGISLMKAGQLIFSLKSVPCGMIEKKSSQV